MSVSEIAAGNVRKRASEILAKVETQRAFADQLLDRSLKTARWPDRDRALLTELTYGTLRWRGKLDWYLSNCVERPLSETDPFLRNLLRLTLYQLLFLDRVPDYAAVNEAVTLAKAHGGRKAAGFVNAVLRRFLRETERMPEPEITKDAIGEIARYWSHPEWLAQRWLEYFGHQELAALLKANNEAAPLCLRAHVRKITRQKLAELLGGNGIETRPAPWSEQALYVVSRIAVDRIPGFDDGLFQVQGEASQLVSQLLQPRTGERILDACAAPGGKTTHIAELMEDEGQVVATDISQRGIELIQQNARRLGLQSIHAVHADMTRKLPVALSGPYDRILIDAPCSGFGTLRSHPEIKWNRTEQDIARLSRLQRDILDRVARYLAPCGVLVYSTCTLIEEENENVVEQFLEHHAGFVLEEAAGYLPHRARSLVRGAYFLALPHRHGTDGFFAARLRKVR